MSNHFGVTNKLKIRVDGQQYDPKVDQEDRQILMNVLMHSAGAPTLLCWTAVPT